MTWAQVFKFDINSSNFELFGMYLILCINIQRVINRLVSRNVHKQSTLSERNSIY